MYIESEKVKFYPSAYRQYQAGGETKNTNPESELNTEYNITSHIAKLLKKNKGCFVVDYIEDVTLEFYLGGYYIHITSPQDILNAFTDATEIWANMKVAPFTPTDNTKGFSELYEVVDYEDSGKNIDELNNNVVSFKGVAFLSTKDNSATFSLQLFTRQNTKKPWSILESSKYILDTREIFNFNGDYSIDEDFYTLYASIDDLYSETSSIDEATINTALTVDGTATFNSQVDLNANLVPTSGSQINIGKSENKIATIYAVELNADKITLNSNITPNGTVSLGLANNPITNIYATNIYGTNLKDVNEIEGGQNNITLKSTIEPSGTIDLGSTSSMFNHIYTDTLTSDGIETLGLKVTDINSTSSFISLYKTILPTSTGTISLGNSNFKFNDIYATTFYGNVTGNLNGNANTATKLNGDNVGNTSSSVYFNNGVPVVSNHYHYMLKDSSGTLTVPYNSSYPTQTPVKIAINSVYLRAGKYSFTITSQLDPIRGSDGTIVEVIIPENLYVSARYETTTTYTNTMFFKWWYYDNNQARQTWLYSRLSILHTVNTDNVKLQVQLGVGYSVGTTKQITWYDVPTTSMVVDYFN